jgi:hypothetical protein
MPCSANPNCPAAVLLALSMMAGELSAEPQGRFTGVGGILITSDDPRALTAWHKDVLRLKVGQCLAQC